MTRSSELRRHLAQGNLEAIEDAWLAQIADAPGDLPFFVEVARAVDREAASPETAQLLLDMLDEHYRGSGDWRLRLDLLRQAGDLLYESRALHEEILETLGHLHGDRPSFDALTEKVGLHRAIEDIPKTWQKVDRLTSLLAFDVGAIVYMEGKGSGHVIDVNMALESFLVRLDTIGDLRVGFAAAAKLLRSLPPHHILRRKHEDPGAIERLRDQAPAELLRIVLESYDGPRTGAEIRRDLAGVVAAGKWSSWWAAARKHKQVLAVGDGRRAYRWAASSADADDEIWQAFEASDPAARIELLRRHTARSPALGERMRRELATSARAATEGDPPLATGIWLALEKLGNAGDDEPTAALVALVARASDLRALARGAVDRGGRERLYDLVRANRRGWQDELTALVEHETEARALDHIAEILGDGDALGRIIDQLLSQPRKAPAAFVWLVERAADNGTWRRRNPIRLLEQTLWALADSPTFGTFRVRLAPAVESGGTVPRLIGDLDAEQAERAISAIEKAGALEPYQSDPLISAIHLKFPSLRQDDVAPLYATADKINEKRIELKTLLEQEIPANRKAIEEARELGDLRENFEYKSARQRHEYLASRAAALDADLTRVRPIDASTVTGNEIVIGSRVTLEAPDRSTRVITILGPWNSDPENDVLSNESDLAQALLGSALGTTVEVTGTPMRVARIEPWES